MKRFIFDPKTHTLVRKEWKPEIVTIFGDSCVKKNKYVSDKIRINNNEVSTGTSRTALYTMPGGVDNGVRYAPLYDSSGLDITEIEANRNLLKIAQANVEEKIKEEFDKISTETVDKISQSVQSSSNSGSSE